MSIALQYQQKIKAELGSSNTQPSTCQEHEAGAVSDFSNYSEFELMRGKLQHDLDKCREYPRDKRLQYIKDDLLSGYMQFLEPYLSGTERYDNPVLVQVMIWLFDVGDFTNALKLAEVCTLENQKMPKVFKRREVFTFVADTVYEYEQAQQQTGNNKLAYFDWVYERLDEFCEVKPIKAKYEKMLADSLFSDEEYNQALEHYNQALILDNSTKCKTKLNKCREKMELKK